jgi:hypothetical protein
MDFDDVPSIPANNIYKARRVSSGKGDATVHKLTVQGLIHPTVTPTKRKLLTPPDAKVVFNALSAGTY